MQEQNKTAINLFQPFPILPFCQFRERKKIKRSIAEKYIPYPMAVTQFVRHLRHSIGNNSKFLRSLPPQSRAFGMSTLRANNRTPSTAKEHREIQKGRPLNQHIPNTTSTQTNDFPKVGAASSPPEFLSSVDPNYKPADPYPGKIEHLTGGRESTGARKPELEVGEMEGITFKVEPLKREGEDTSTKRARLLCMLANSPSPQTVRALLHGLTLMYSRPEPKARYP